MNAQEMLNQMKYGIKQYIETQKMCIFHCYNCVAQVPTHPCPFILPFHSHCDSLWSHSADQNENRVKSFQFHPTHFSDGIGNAAGKEKEQVQGRAGTS